MQNHPSWRRRQLLQMLLAIGGGAISAGFAAAAPQPAPLLTRPIPSSGEVLPLIGLGSWITFNVGNDRAARDACAEVMRQFFRGGRTHDRFLAHVWIRAGSHR